MADAPATTTADIATRDGVGFRKRRRKLDKKRLAKILARKLKLAMEAGEACDDPGKKRRSKGKGRGLARGRGKGPMGAPGDKSEATYHGGKSMLRAWFGKGLLKRKVKGKRNGGAVSEFVGHKRRRYVVTKRGGGRYTIRRRK